MTHGYRPMVAHHSCAPLIVRSLFGKRPRSDVERDLSRELWGAPCPPRKLVRTGRLRALLRRNLSVNVSRDFAGEHTVRLNTTKKGQAEVVWIERPRETDAPITHRKLLGFQVWAPEPRVRWRWLPIPSSLRAGLARTKA